MKKQQRALRRGYTRILLVIMVVEWVLLIVEKQWLIEDWIQKFIDKNPRFFSRNKLFRR